ncbi:hypothetical protein M441DRAFT_178139 [Trichoderma asperellum CBS 433.97]|uniref:Protein kinase domain-containing protein n=1 Tax=Trichoderma asperellum (strain ATCC 204424 / CBS 433.97 / NBRC 101777) TaxID=1042311 RepID=A0A2T3YUQ4_TRIA4|nr:hypothetical protein M441DRAFT_178139 [Trichoderma asperellum CBS 433.97]PTB36285.1 hypothetical protein M441DRAFT_178139 [Trichoderma asperellum CBS 433.97]
MSATEGALIRVYRDIEGDERQIQHNLAALARTRLEIRNLGERICDAHGRAPDAAPLDGNAIFQLHVQRAMLYRQLAAADQQIAALHQGPRALLRLQGYLEACHSIDLAMPARDLLVPAPEVKTHDRILPKRWPRSIVPAPDFAAKQLRIWSRMADSAELRTNACYPSITDLEWVRGTVDGIHVGCVSSLAGFMHRTVDEAVDTILDHIVQSESLVNGLEIGGFVLTQPGSEPRIATARSLLMRDGMRAMVAFRHADSQEVPLLVACYRPPHRLRLNEILKGFQRDIDVERDVIGRIGNDFAFTSRCLVAAVVTQLYDRMRAVGTRFGYISTGEALVFLKIMRDARFVQYSVCVPRRDVEADAETGLHRTAAAQVLAFTLRALRAVTLRRALLEAEQPVDDEACDLSAEQRQWRVNPDNVFNRIPPMLRKMERNIQYVPHDWRPLLEASPLEQRARSLVWPGSRGRTNEADFNDYGVFKFLSIHRIDPQGERIDQRPFCTPRCLLGLARGDALDKECPNFRHHGDKHMSRAQFLRRLQTQLDREVAGRDDTNCQPICRSGFYTALFKVRLASHGYTLLMKGVVQPKVKYLRHECGIYDSLKEIQGRYVPVCLGMIQTRDPITRLHGKYVSFMLLGGFPGGLMPLRQCVTAGVDKGEIVDAVDAAFEAIHGQRVLQYDPEPRNMLYDADGKRAVIADFERAVWNTLVGQQVLDMSVRRAGAATRYAVRTNVMDGWFERERGYVRERVAKFCESDY